MAAEVRFWDSSAIVPLIVQEGVSDLIGALARENHGMVVWWGTRVELASALRRGERDAAMSDDDVSRAFEGLGIISEAWTEILPSERMRSRAQRLLAVHPLRAADALQLAAALAWQEDDAAGAELVCLDRKLAQAAAREGFAVLDGR